MGYTIGMPSLKLSNVEGKGGPRIEIRSDLVDGARGQKKLPDKGEAEAPAN